MIDIEVPHGKWIKNGNKIGYTGTYTCSVCKRSLIWEDKEPIAFIYCPWCGAKLKDTEKENENKSM